MDNGCRGSVVAAEWTVKNGGGSNCSQPAFHRDGPCDCGHAHLREKCAAWSEALTVDDLPHTTYSWRVRFWRIGVVLALGLVVLTSPTRTESNGGVRVLPLGDSITDGFTEPGGYRTAL